MKASLFTINKDDKNHVGKTNKHSYMHIQMEQIHRSGAALMRLQL